MNYVSTKLSVAYAIMMIKRSQVIILWKRKKENVEKEEEVEEDRNKL